MGNTAHSRAYEPVGAICERVGTFHVRIGCLRRKGTSGPGSGFSGGGRPRVGAIGFESVIAAPVAEVKGVDVVGLLDCLSDFRIDEIQDTQSAVLHLGDRFDAMKVLSVSGGEVGQTSQLGKSVGEVVAVGVDDGDAYVLGSAVEEQEVGAHPTPVTLSVLVCDCESIG